MKTKTKIFNVQIMMRHSYLEGMIYGKILYKDNTLYSVVTCIINNNIEKLTELLPLLDTEKLNNKQELIGLLWLFTYKTPEAMNLLFDKGIQRPDPSLLFLHVRSKEELHFLLDNGANIDVLNSESEDSKNLRFVNNILNVVEYHDILQEFINIGLRIFNFALVLRGVESLNFLLKLRPIFQNVVALVLNFFARHKIDCTDMLSLILDKYPDIIKNQDLRMYNINKDCCSLLEWAVAYKNVNAVKLLVKRGATFIQKDYIIIYAVMSKQLDIVTELVNAGIDISHIDVTHILDFCSHNDIKIFEYMFLNGLDIVKNLGFITSIACRRWDILIRSPLYDAVTNYKFKALSYHMLDYPYLFEDIFNKIDIIDKGSTEEILSLFDNNRDEFFLFHRRRCYNKFNKENLEKAFLYSKDCSDLTCPICLHYILENEPVDTITTKCCPRSALIHRNCYSTNVKTCVICRKITTFI